MMKLRATATITCDTCGAQAVVETTVAERFRVDALVALALSRFRETGWQILPSNKERPALHYCSSCRDDREEP